MYRILFLISILISFVISACSNIQPTSSTVPEENSSPTLVDVGSPTQVPAYPEPVISAPTADLGYPPPTKHAITPLPSPTYDQSKGIIKGRLLINNKPISDAILSLAEVIRDSEGREMVVSYDPSSSPTTTTDTQGYFVFVNVLPSKYGLILDTVIKSYLLHYPEEEDKQILITVEMSQEFDLGDLDYNSLPVQAP